MDYLLQKMAMHKMELSKKLIKMLYKKLSKLILLWKVPPKNLQVKTFMRRKVEITSLLQGNKKVEASKVLLLEGMELKLYKISNLRMELFIQVNGRTKRETEMESKYGLTDQSMKVNG